MKKIQTIKITQMIDIQIIKKINDLLILPINIASIKKTRGLLADLFPGDHRRASILISVYSSPSFSDCLSSKFNDDFLISRLTNEVYSHHGYDINLIKSSISDWSSFIDDFKESLKSSNGDMSNIRHESSIKEGFGDLLILTDIENSITIYTAPSPICKSVQYWRKNNGSVCNGAYFIDIPCKINNRSNYFTVSSHAIERYIIGVSAQSGKILEVNFDDRYTGVDKVTHYLPGHCLQGI